MYKYVLLTQCSASASGSASTHARSTTSCRLSRNRDTYRCERRCEFS